MSRYNENSFSKANKILHNLKEVIKMKLNKLINKLATYNSIDILDFTGMRMFPVCTVRDFKEQHKIEDMKKYKVKHIIAFSQEPGTVTVYVEEVKK